MNAFTLLLILFGMMTLGSASVLYFSFKEKVDVSGKYFLSAELMVLLVISLVVMTNLNQDLEQPLILFISNFLNAASEIAVIFSLYSLTNKIRSSKYLLLLVLAATFCALIEYTRINIDRNLPALLTALSSATLALITYIICKNPKSQELKSNLFLRWVGYIEVGLFCIALIRIGSYFLGAPIVPRQPSTPVALLYVLFISLSIFRYVFYQSLRISWVSAGEDSLNPLNQNLAKAVQEKNQLLEELISSNRKIGIGALASSLAHQLSQPITGLSFQIHTAKHNLTNLLDTKTSIKILDKASLELEKLTSLVSGLRRLFGFQETQFEPIDLIRTCDDVIELIEPTLISNHIKLVKNYSNSSTIIGNSIQLQQVLINLFNNAIYAINKSNPNIRAISIDITQANNFAKICIKDSGPGINLKNISEIFELYKTTKKEGLGVGLWLSKIIVEKHQGRIKYVTKENSGAIFEIEIPLANLNKTEISR